MNATTQITVDAAMPQQPRMPFVYPSGGLALVLESWRQQIASEDLFDCLGYHTEVGMEFRAGHLVRGTKSIAYTPHGFGQLIGLLTQQIGKPNNLASCIRWLSPLARSHAFDDVKARSKRPQDKAILFRTAYDPAVGRRYLRAAMSDIHSGSAHDDLALSRVLETALRDQATLASVQRGHLETHGTVVLNSEAPVLAAVHFSNSEVGCRSVGFTGGAVIRLVDGIVRLPDEHQVVSEVTVAVEHASKRVRHTAPARFGQDEKERIAEKRMLSAFNVALGAAQAIPALWERAIKSFPLGVTVLTSLGGWDVFLDLVTEKTKNIEEQDREALREVLTDDARLHQVPHGSAAHIAAAFAVIGSKAKHTDEAIRLQKIAGWWLGR